MGISVEILTSINVDQLNIARQSVASKLKEIEEKISKLSAKSLNQESNNELLEEKNRFITLSERQKDLNILSDAIAGLSTGATKNVDVKTYKIALNFPAFAKINEIQDFSVKDIRNIMTDYLDIDELLLCSDVMDSALVKSALNKKTDMEMKEFCLNLDTKTSEIADAFIRVFKQFADDELRERFYKNADLQKASENLIEVLKKNFEVESGFCSVPSHMTFVIKMHERMNVLQQERVQSMIQSMYPRNIADIDRFNTKMGWD